MHFLEFKMKLKKEYKQSTNSLAGCFEVSKETKEIYAKGIWGTMNRKLL
jgi:hypothetical protein